MTELYITRSLCSQWTCVAVVSLEQVWFDVVLESFVERWAVLDVNTDV